MKALIATTCTAALVGTSALAGGLAEPIEMAPALVIEDTAGGSSQNLIVPLILIALIAAAASSGDSGDTVGNVGNASDVRLKDNIRHVGTAANGLPLYHFTYTGSDIVFEGVMAQDVLAHTPEAVITRPDGTLAVDYRMIGIDLKIVE